MASTVPTHPKAGRDKPQESADNDQRLDQGQPLRQQRSRKKTEQGNQINQHRAAHQQIFANANHHRIANTQTQVA